MSSSHRDEACAFDTLMRPHLKRLYRLAFRLTGSVADAEDLLQDVLCKLYDRRDELTSINDLAPWASRVLYNRFIDDVRKHRRARLSAVVEISPSIHVDVEQIGDETHGPATTAELGFDIKRLTEALAKLSLEHRTVLLMHDSEGYKLEEIQVITGIPVGTVKSRLHRARARMRELLTPDGTF